MASHKTRQFKFVYIVFGTSFFKFADGNVHYKYHIWTDLLYIKTGPRTPWSISLHYVDIHQQYTGDIGNITALDNYPNIPRRLQAAYSGVTMISLFWNFNFPSPYLTYQNLLARSVNWNAWNGIILLNVTTYRYQHFRLLWYNYSRGTIHLHSGRWTITLSLKSKREVVNSFVCFQFVFAWDYLTIYVHIIYSFGDMYSQMRILTVSN